jgi:asparagine synthase (glutamine-hydrolysing)
MCGIAGAVAREPSRDLIEVVLRLTDALAHRGPDGEGYWRDGMRDGRVPRERLDGFAARLVIGHRRLSIVDLEGGDQPMADAAGRIRVSYNGEIYNHLALRRELEGKGHAFRTRCDTEVIVNGWLEWGAELFGRLNGIFAVAIADSRTNEVVLARDPVGVKPLYVGVDGTRTWWASELAAARSAGLVVQSISPDALKLFLTLRFVPAPATIFEGVWKLPPGHWARVCPDTAGSPPVLQRYETVIASSAEPRGRAEWRDALLAEIDRSVERQLMADVPVASLLSGGVDSTLVTQLMTERLPYMPMTYGIGFSSDGRASEAVSAALAAAEMQVPHDSIEVGDDEYLSRWPETFRAVGEPVANSGGLLVGLLCESVGKRHKVVLTGQGADEPLGGYPRHMVERLRGVARLSPAAVRLASRLVLGPDNRDRLARALAAGDRLDRYVQIFAVVPPAEVDGLVEDASASAAELAREAVARWTRADAEVVDSVNELLRVDARMSLADDLLMIADTFSMRSSVELRVPFLDLELLELVDRMPSKYKLSRLGERKWLYREGARARLPKPMAERLCGSRARLGRKHGFSTPLRSWFETPGAALAHSADWTPALATVPHLRADVVNRRLRSSGEGLAWARQRAALYALAMWRGTDGLSVDAGCARKEG